MVETTLALALAEAIDPRYRSLVDVAAFGGLRSGELLALRVRGRGRAAWHGADLHEAKTDAGRRTVAMPREVMARIERHIEAYAQTGPDGALSPGRGTRHCAAPRCRPHGSPRARQLVLRQGYTSTICGTTRPR